MRKPRVMITKVRIVDLCRATPSRGTSCRVQQVSCETRVKLEERQIRCGESYRDSKDSRNAQKNVRNPYFVEFGVTRTGSCDGNIGAGPLSNIEAETTRRPPTLAGMLSSRWPGSFQGVCGDRATSNQSWTLKIICPDEDDTSQGKESIP